MVIRFKHTEMKADLLRARFTWIVNNFDHGNTDLTENNPLSPFSIRKHMYLLPDCSLFIDDDYYSDPETHEICGQILVYLRAHGFSDGDIIVPRKFSDQPIDTDSDITNHDDDASKTAAYDPDDDIIDLGDLHPEIYDDGHFEEEFLYNWEHRFDREEDDPDY